MAAQLEHVNYTVSDPQKTAAWMREVFGWRIRWEGPSMDGGYSMHVGTDNHYVAIYSPGEPKANGHNNYGEVGGLNHVAVTVDDLAPVEKSARDHGFRVGQHYDYEPGKRFYFYDDDEIEYEVVSYA